MNQLKRRSLWTLLCALALPWWAQAGAQTTSPRVRIVTNLGTMEAELFSDKVPETVANFVQYVQAKHYDGTVFHRVIGNFMVQGGGFDTQYRQKPTRAPIRHEGRAAQAAGLRNTVGTLSMARTPDPNSATAQFFINVADNAFLDPSAQQAGYVVFGKLTVGQDVLQKIRQVPTGSGGPFPTDVPRSPVVIESITLLP